MENPSKSPLRIASMGNPGIAGTVVGPTARLADAESPVDPVAVTV